MKKVVTKKRKALQENSKEAAASGRSQQPTIVS